VFHYAGEMPKHGWALIEAEHFVPELRRCRRSLALTRWAMLSAFAVVDDTGEVATSRASATLVPSSSSKIGSERGNRLLAGVEPALVRAQGHTLASSLSAPRLAGATQKR
jgi:hypothetical protein